jgi:hypothetical protein
MESTMSLLLKNQSLIGLDRLRVGQVLVSHGELSQGLGSDRQHAVCAVCGMLQPGKGACSGHLGAASLISSHAPGAGSHCLDGHYHYFSLFVFSLISESIFLFDLFAIWHFF